MLPLKHPHTTAFLAPCPLCALLPFIPRENTIRKTCRSVITSYANLPTHRSQQVPNHSLSEPHKRSYEKAEPAVS